MRVGILGGTGFVGSYLVDALLARGHQPVLLVREGAADRVPGGEATEVVAGEVSDADAVAALVDSTAALIYNIGILREFPARGIRFEDLHWLGAKRVMDAASAAGGRRFILMSANGVRADGTPYQRTKYQAEEYLRSSGLDYSIFRPSVIFGPPRGRMEIATQLANDVIRPPFPAPLFYGGLVPTNAGGFRMAPVHVEEVAIAFANAVDDPETYGKTFLLCGPEDLTWREMLTRVAAAAGKPGKAMLPVPADLLRFGALLLDRFAAYPVTADQMRMLLEGNTCEASAGTEVVKGQRRFDASELAYLAAGG